MEKMIQTKETREEVLRFLAVGHGYGSGYGDGSGDGSGYGDGDGSGYGDGDGHGSGDGHGDGSGYGDGDGHGSGDGHGDGDGSGDGYGSGYGYGYGDGHGSGIVSVNGNIVHDIDDVQTLIDGVHGNYAVGRVLKSDLTTEPCFVAKVGNYFAHGETLHKAMADATAKYQQNMSVEDRIRLFNEQYPDRDKKVAAAELFRWHNVLTGSCEMGRKAFCEERGLDYMNGEYSVNEFIELTKDAYDGEVIKQLKITN